MSHHESVRRFAGICVGGPYDGMMQAHPAPMFRICKSPAVTLSRAPKPVELIVTTGTYEFEAGKNGRPGEWRWKGWD